MTALRLELRRSPLRWWVPGVLGLQLLLIFGFEDQWQTVWSQASAKAQYPLLFSGPVLAAAAAWSASRTRRRELGQYLSSVYRPRWLSEFWHLAASATYAIGCFAVGVLAAWSAAALAGAPGGPWPTYLVLGLLTTLGSVAIGHLLGVLTPTLVSPVFAAAIVYLTIIYTYPYPNLAFWVVSGRPQAEVQLPALAVRALVVALLVLIVVMVAALPARDRRHRIALVVAPSAVVAFAGSLALVSVVGPLREHRDPPPPECAGADPRVCVWPDHRKMLDRLALLAQRIPEASHGTLSVPDTFYEEGIRGPAPGITREAGRPPGELTLDSERAALSQMVRQTLPDVPPCDSGPEPNLTEVFHARDQLFAWVYAGVVGGTGEFAEDPALQQELDHVLALPPDEQIAWSHERQEVIAEGGCGPT